MPDSTPRSSPQSLTRFDQDGARQVAHAAIDASGPATPATLDERMAAHAAVDTTRWQIEPSNVPGWWAIRQIVGTGAASRSDLLRDERNRVRLFGSAAAASNFIDAQATS